MKRRLNILCVIVMLVLSYSVLEAGYYLFLGVKLGAEAGVEIAKNNKPDSSEYREMVNLRVIGLLPHGLSTKGVRLLSDSVYNEKSGRYVPASYSSMVISVETHALAWKRTVNVLLVFLHLGLSVWGMVLFIRLIISINKSDIFNWRNVRRLRRLGVVLILGFCSVLAGAYMDLASVREVFSLRGYDLSLSEMANVTTLVLGLCALIVGEVFAIGLKMKEEQDLTI
ncbi:DUF2975 domain-containing protein [Bacteroides heparinolyticus]|uniref:DUF2975 domain-containing protein n=1 Tax=Prevotella heparinolytica TaxID=28113 RepID=UPI00359F779F